MMLKRVETLLYGCIKNLTHFHGNEKLISSAIGTKNSFVFLVTNSSEGGNLFDNGKLLGWCDLLSSDRYG